MLSAKLINTEIDQELIQERLETIGQSVEVMRALAHPLRLTILEFIDSLGTTQVFNIHNSLELEQSVTSQHLKILRNAELVNTEREGKFIHYSVNYEVIRSINMDLDKFFKKWKEPVLDK